MNTLKVLRPSRCVCADLVLWKRDWKPDTTLKKILMVACFLRCRLHCVSIHAIQVIRCLLIEPGPDSALNEEAAVLMQEDFEAYSKRARYMRRNCCMFPDVYPCACRLMTKVHATGASEEQPTEDVEGVNATATAAKVSKAKGGAAKKKKKLTDRL